MKNLLAILLLLTFNGCATTELPRGMLAQFSGKKSLEMNQLRRDCDLLDTAACFFSGRPAPSLPGLSILQGAAAGNHAVFSVLLPVTEKVQWFLFLRQGRELKNLMIARSFSRLTSTWRVDRIEVEALDASKTYDLIAADEEGRLIDIRSFRVNLSPAPAHLHVAFLFGSGKINNPNPAFWEALRAQKPQAIFMLGDNVSGIPAPGQPDVSPEELWAAYVENRMALPLFRNQELIPTFTTWNELDYGMRQGNQTYKKADPSREIQEIFFPVLADAKIMKEGPGTAKAVVLSGQTFVLLDDRSFREGDSRPPYCDHDADACRGLNFVNEEYDAHFGHLQEKWALEFVERAQGPVWLISGDSWFKNASNPSVYESNQPQDFQRFRETLKDAATVAAKEGHSFPIYFAGGALTSGSQAVVPFGKYQTIEYSIGGPDTGLRMFSMEYNPPAAKPAKRGLKKNAPKEGYKLSTILIGNGAAKEIKMTVGDAMKPIKKSAAKKKR